jgi:hypothetical protein
LNRLTPEVGLNWRLSAFAKAAARQGKPPEPAGWKGHPTGKKTFVSGLIPPRGCINKAKTAGMAD